MGTLFILYFLNDYKNHISIHGSEYGITKENINIITNYTKYAFVIILLYGLYTSNYKFKKGNNLLENLLDHK